jgi:DhnA family fructose-bisphosphate aldolase class Ia
MSSIARLHRLFAADGKCFDVAMDHGFFNEYGFLAGIENAQRAIEILVDAMPDAIQLPLGTASLLQAIPGPRKPALVLRTDVANVYGSSLPHNLMSELIADSTEHALRLDAVAVVVNLLLLPDQPELHRDCVRNVTALKAAADRVGMPVMVEPLVMQANSVAGGYMVDGDVRKILPLVRQAVELGADIIKSDPTTDVAEYHRVVEIAGGVPVLVRGGGRASDAEILARTEGLMAQGANGIVYGRNVIQHHDPAGMTMALMRIVHDGASADEAAQWIRVAEVPS